MRAAWKLKTAPRAYQWDGVDAIDEFDGRALLADEMGLGKSLQALLWAAENSYARPILIICPASLKWNWEREVRTHFGVRSLILEGRKPPHNAIRLLKSAEVVIINYDILPEWRKPIKRARFKLVILDEVHMIGNPGTLRSQNVKSICRRPPFVIGLTGTPFNNRPAELYPILNILRPDEYNSPYAFYHRYCRPRRRPWGWEFKGATRIPELRRRLKEDCMVRRLKKHVAHELPEKLRTMQVLDIKRKEYDHALEDFLGWLRTRSKHAAIKAAKAEQLVRMGYLKRLAAELKLPKVMDWTAEYLDRTDTKLILFGIHKPIVQGLFDRFRKVAVVVDGSVPKHERQVRVDRFSSDPKTRILIGNIRAAGVGFNMIKATDVGFAEFGWTPGEHKQAEDRAHRLGQTQDVTCHYFVARGTIEEMLCDLIQKKQETSDAILGDDATEDFTQLDIFDQLLTQLQEAH